jgi:hypothetical protein
MARQILSLAVATVVALVALPGAQEPAGFPAGSLKGLEFRSIGPTLTTGRIQDIEIDPRQAGPGLPGVGRLVDAAFRTIIWPTARRRWYADAVQVPQ